MRANTRLLSVLLLLPSLAYAQFDVDSLQSLFTDKKQRVLLNAARSGNNSNPKARDTSKVQVSGYMTRSDGKSVVWANGKNTLDESTIDNVRVDGRSVGQNTEVTIRVDGKTARVKPGETWMKETNKIVDNY